MADEGTAFVGIAGPVAAGRIRIERRWRGAIEPRAGEDVVHLAGHRLAARTSAESYVVPPVCGFRSHRGKELPATGTRRRSPGANTHAVAHRVTLTVNGSPGSTSLRSCPGSKSPSPA